MGKIQIGHAYCIKCKTVRAMKESHMERYKNGMPVEKGLCVHCGCRITRMMSKEDLLVYEVNEQKGSEEGDPD